MSPRALTGSATPNVPSDWWCSGVIRGAFVPCVTSNLFMVTFKAREVAGSCYGQRDHCSAFRTGVLRGLSRSRSRLPTTVTACQFAHSPFRPKAARGTTRLSMEGLMGGTPKASATASGRRNQPAGEDPESNSCCPGFHDIRARNDASGKDFTIILTEVVFQLPLQRRVEICVTMFATADPER